MNPEPDPTPATPPAEPAAEDQAPKPAHTHRRTGKVAGLAKSVRDEISQMLLDGVTYRGIIQKLGDSGKDLVEDHIGSWYREGGYDEWLAELQRTQDLQDASRTIASAQLYELLLSFDPRAFAQALLDKPELYLRLINALARLSEGEAACGHHRAQESLIEAKLKPSQPGNGPAIVSPETLAEIARLIKLL